MFTLRLTLTARRQHRELQTAALKTREMRTERGTVKPTRREEQFRQVQETLSLLAGDPGHPGLQTHPHHSLENPFDPKAKVFDACPQQPAPGAYRIFWCYGRGENEIAVLAIAPHP
jgi:hypothetical protein